MSQAVHVNELKDFLVARVVPHLFPVLSFWLLAHCPCCWFLLNYSTHKKFDSSEWKTRSDCRYRMGDSRTRQFGREQAQILSLCAHLLNPSCSRICGT
ncbi:hypothetical protein MPTK1_4g04790 [Marchantia polymorpha subsp. ruderalis]|uniref:Uncharacterized protein n=2 Tax=Marchantia polymorpha TaxID=3197 RepID=A0AAF6B6F5_MARPO|nr:hypothetical protein MARPO_0150s0004 [Marchantia polymorpha]PTQ28981.1 hypothetical protein MARPO_0150s0004 [Marchantia polymorpha]BBN07588.1 hypothetical protein Mp_4g04790 [Marchantia polymorpha subsp. ruderalis]BBN07589.1 hypothetical protein Mp_4g04790 [Marchantia polymorpha subsp. ruderalis]|eukprot:PTQ28980.1 hypothetical protein MARPO_0150s0004 [Marchantia polymorpha]